MRGLQGLLGLRSALRRPSPLPSPARRGGKMPSLEAYSVWQPLRSPGSAWAILILIDIDRLLKSSGLSRLELSYARQHLFPKELECAQSALRIFSTRTLEGEIDHPSANLIAALLDLLHDRIRTTDKIRW